jgi:hypothetical protein
MRKITRQVIENMNEELRIANAKVDMYRKQVVTLSNTPNMKPTKAELEMLLADINYKEKYPLCHEIKNAKCIFVEFYVHGKSIGKFTKEGAEDYARKNLKQDYKAIGQLGTMSAYYEVKKIRKERE